MAYRNGITRSMNFVARNSNKSAQAAFVYKHPRWLCVAPGRSSLDEPGLLFFSLVKNKPQFEFLDLMLLFGMVGSGIVPLITCIRSEITKQFLCYYEMIQTSDIIVISPCRIIY